MQWRTIGIRIGTPGEHNRAVADLYYSHMPLYRLKSSSLPCCQRLCREANEIQFHPWLKFEGEGKCELRSHLWHLSCLIPLSPTLESSINELQLHIVIRFPEEYPSQAPTYALTGQIELLPHLAPSWTPNLWNPRFDTAIGSLMIAITDNLPSINHSSLIRSLKKREEWASDLLWISLGCANDSKQCYPNRIRHLIHGTPHSEWKEKPAQVDILLIDPNMTPNRGSFHHRHITIPQHSKMNNPCNLPFVNSRPTATTDGAHSSHPSDTAESTKSSNRPNSPHRSLDMPNVQSVCVTVSSRPLLGEDIEALEEVVLEALLRGSKVIVGDFAVGSLKGSISYYLRTMRADPWEKSITWAKPLSRVGDPYEDGFPDFSPSLPTSPMMTRRRDPSRSPQSRKEPQAEISENSNGSSDPLLAFLHSWLQPGSIDNLFTLTSLQLDDFETDQGYQRATKFASLNSRLAASVIRSSMNPASSSTQKSTLDSLPTEIAAGEAS